MSNGKIFKINPLIQARTTVYKQWETTASDRLEIIEDALIDAQVDCRGLRLPGAKTARG